MYIKEDFKPPVEVTRPSLTQSRMLRECSCDRRPRLSRPLIRKINRLVGTAKIISVQMCR